MNFEAEDTLATMIKARSQKIVPTTTLEKQQAQRQRLATSMMPEAVGAPTCSACHKEEMQTLVAAIEKTQPVAAPEDLGAAITRNRTR